MDNPYELDGNDSHGYICQDCRYFQAGTCTEEDEDGEICNRFELPKSKRDKEIDDAWN